jgi:hypothetical protein
MSLIKALSAASNSSTIFPSRNVNKSITSEIVYLGGAAGIAICRAILGRAKYTSTGTYAGNTNVRIDLMTDGLTA